MEGTPVHWYVVSDCSMLPHKAAKVYGQKVSWGPVNDVIPELILIILCRVSFVAAPAATVLMSDLQTKPALP